MRADASSVGGTGPPRSVAPRHEFRKWVRVSPSVGSALVWTSGGGGGHADKETLCLRVTLHQGRTRMYKVTDFEVKSEKELSNTNSCGPVRVVLRTRPES